MEIRVGCCGFPLYGRIAYLRLHGKEGYKYRYTNKDLASLWNKMEPHAQARGTIVLRDSFHACAWGGIPPPENPFIHGQARGFLGAWINKGTINYIMFNNIYMFADASRFTTSLKVSQEALEKYIGAL